MKHIATTLSKALCGCLIAAMLPTAGFADDNTTSGHIFFYKDGHIVYGITPEAVGRVKLGADKSTLSLRDLQDAEIKAWNVADVDSMSVVAREYVLNFTTPVQSGNTYNGFKGGCPVFSPDGRTVYNITFNKITTLYAFDAATGVERWHYTPAVNASSYNKLTVNPVSGDIYYGTSTAGQFYCISADGELRWTYTDAGTLNQTAAPAVSADGTTVFLVDKNGRVAALDASTGSERWNASVGKAGCGLLINAGELVVGTAAAVSFLDASSGTEIAKLEFADSAKGMSDNSGFAVAADKTTAYVPQLGGLLSSFDLAKHEWIVKDLQVAGNNLYEPCVAPSGTLCVGSKDSKVYLVKGDLSEVIRSVQTSTYDKAKTNGFNYSHPVVTSDNVFYITAGGVTSITLEITEADGVTGEWTVGASANQKQMGGNNFIDGVLFSAFIGAANDNGAFIGRYVGGERAAGWSSHGGDICGSCCVK